VVVQPFSDITSTEADTRLDLEMWNHVALCVAIDHFGADRKDGCKFTGVIGRPELFKRSMISGPPDGRCRIDTAARRAGFTKNSIAAHLPATGRKARGPRLICPTLFALECSSKMMGRLARWRTQEGTFSPCRCCLFCRPNRRKTVDSKDWRAARRSRISFRMS
jgi:hypothetical protein